MRRLIIPALAASILLTGCSSTTEPATEQETETSTPAPVVEDSATEEQIASVIAEYEPDWRETIDGAGDCRFLWVMGGDSPADDMNAMSCYLKEQTIVTTAQLVVSDLEALDIPESMSSLVTNTTNVLTSIGEVDLVGVCGEDDVPADTDECTDTIGTLNGLYMQLDSTLNSWSPYL
ncbi:hypothetical protein [Paramicrobacterium agarici]|uniref:hypothetical protein n=1 Tax=Paramicrobacterium agarici TaxID=630514 RepID=UPI00114FA930|nr:hypothetical protein [Microbacterium agarici]TQO23770.1 hypothetical protein FB385_2631 [Microbacterium agarici]